MKQSLTLVQYIKKRNGVSMGTSRSLRNMMYRSLGAGTFAGFWRYWNPIFGYYLGKYVFKPLKKVLPSFPALILTFIACGAFHDAVSMMVGGRIVFFFTPWFTFMSTLVVLGNAFKIEYTHMSWLARAAINLTLIGSCLLLTFYLQPFFKNYTPI